MITVKHFGISKHCSCQFSGIFELFTVDTLEKPKTKIKDEVKVTYVPASMKGDFTQRCTQKAVRIFVKTSIVVYNGFVWDNLDQTQ